MTWMKKLMLLGGLRYLLPVIESAHRMGYYVITVDYLPDNVAHRFSDEYHNVSILDREAVLELAKKLKIDGIMSFACDPGVLTAAYVADKMQLPSPGPYESVRILQNKGLFRDFLEKHGFNVPLHKSYTDKISPLDDVKNFNWPLIVKPVDLAGSKGVTRVDRECDLSAAVEMAFRCSFTKEIIIEEYLEKMGYASDSDCFSIDGEIVFSSFNCQYFDERAANPYTPAGFVWPSNMPQKSVDELESEVQRLISLLNMGTSIYNVETRLALNGKPYIMEVSPRGGGNRLAEIVKLVYGVDLIAANINGALGMPVSIAAHQSDTCWAEYIVHSEKQGKFRDLEIDEEFRCKYVVENDLWVSFGDKVEAFTGANQTIGTIVLHFDSEDQARLMLPRIKDYIRVVVD